MLVNESIIVALTMADVVTTTTAATAATATATATTTTTTTTTATATATATSFGCNCLAANLLECVGCLGRLRLDASSRYCR